nr:hypothetical protein OG781_41405 [Streptomyces sp. NBC_00830]
MLEKVGAEVLAERERIAARVRDELVAAGLPVVAPGLNRVLSQGAEVTAALLAGALADAINRRSCQASRARWSGGRLCMPAGWSP